MGYGGGKSAGTSDPARDYGRGDPARPNSGGSSTRNSPSGSGTYGADGVCIVRVPKANYTGDMLDGAFDIATTRQSAVKEKAKEKIKRNRKR